MYCWRVYIYSLKGILCEVGNLNMCLIICLIWLDLLVGNTIHDRKPECISQYKYIHKQHTYPKL